MRTIREMMETKHERMKAKTDAFQEKVDDGQEGVKARVDSLASWIDANEGDMKVTLNACLEDMEENPAEQKSVAVHEEVPKEEAEVQTSGALKKRHGDGI
jgi:hypothetical protein